MPQPRFRKRLLSLLSLSALALAFAASAPRAAAQDFTGRELLSITRVAHGGSEYSNLKYLTVQSEGYISLAPFGVITPAGTATLGQVQVSFTTRDYQDRSLRRRFEAAPNGSALAILGGAGGTAVTGVPIFLVYNGNEGSGVFLGTPFRIGDVTMSRQWAMMSFNTLNLAVERAVGALRLRDEPLNGVGHYVVEVRLNSTDTVRYWINKNNFLVSKLLARSGGRPYVEEERSDYQKVPGGCLMLPFRIVTKVNGQQVADMRVRQYDFQTEIPSTLFTVVTSQ